MDHLVEAYLNRVASRPRSKFGQDFLTEYFRMREAGSIVPSALNVHHGHAMLCEASEDDTNPLRERFATAAFEFLKTDSRLDEDDLSVLMNMCTSDEFIDAMVESAVGTGTDIDTALLCLFDARPERREACQERLLEAFDRMYPDISEEVEAANQTAELISGLFGLDDDAEFDSALEALGEEELQALAPVFEGDDEELNELSKTLLGRYVTKASDDSVVQGHRYASPKADTSSKAFRKIHRRSLGIRRAVRRLTKEEFTDIDDWKNFIIESHGDGVTFRKVLSGNGLGDTYAYADGRRLGHRWDGTRGYLHEDTEAARSLVTHHTGSERDEPSMALSWQPKSVKKTLKDILRSSFVPGSKGDRMFAALHRVELTPDANGNDDAVFNGSNVSQYSRSPRYGYRTGEDAQHYDDLKERSPILESATTPSARMRTSNTPWAIQVLSGLRPRN